MEEDGDERGISEKWAEGREGKGRERGELISGKSDNGESSGALCIRCVEQQTRGGCQVD